MINIKDLTFSYPKSNAPAVVDANVSIGPGLYLLMGENGAGKTTLLHIMSGLLFPTKGQCLINDVDTTKRLPETMSNVFFLSDNFDCPFSTVNEMARRFGCFYPSFNFDILKANLYDFGLTGDEKVKRLSLGMKRKAFTAFSLSVGAEHLFLDEPTNGMDINSKKILRKMFSTCIDDAQTAIVSTHNVHDLDKMFDHIMLMRKGKLEFVMPVWEITERAAFVRSSRPIEDAIYQEPDAGYFNAIIANEDDIETDIDFPLFYSAMMSPVGDIFIKFLNTYKR